MDSSIFLGKPGPGLAHIEIYLGANHGLEHRPPCFHRTKPAGTRHHPADRDEARLGCELGEADEA